MTEAFIDKLVSAGDTYACLPLFADTGKMKRGELETLGHNYNPRDGSFDTEQIGAFRRFEKVRDEYGVSLMGEARVSKRNEAVCAALLQLFAEKALHVSFEIVAAQIREEDGVSLIDAADGNELMGMAVVSIPAYPEATAFALVAEQKKEENQVNEEQVKKNAELEMKLK